MERIKSLGFEALVNIGGDGSQRISQALIEKGMNVVGVPKTIDNDLLGTDLTFGFSTAVQIASESLDKLVTTAESHHRVMLMEVMGRDAGWIALHTAIAGGAEICLIPEIPFHIDKVLQTINKRYHKGKGFANIVIAEGAKPAGAVVGKKPWKWATSILNWEALPTTCKCFWRKKDAPLRSAPLFLAISKEEGYRLRSTASWPLLWG